MRKALLLIITISIIIVSCINPINRDSKEFVYSIEGNVLNGDSTYISLYIPSKGLDSRETVQILDNKYRFQGTASDFESAFIRFEDDIIDPSAVYCAIPLFIEKDPVEFNFDIDTTDFCLCFKNMEFVKGSTNLYFDSIKDNFDNVRVWIFSDSVLMDSMHRNIYPDIKANYLDVYEENCNNKNHPAVSLFYLDFLVNSRNIIFDPNHLTNNEKLKFEKFLNNIDPSLHHTKTYKSLNITIKKLRENEEKEFKTYRLINRVGDSIDLIDKISQNHLTLLYFWHSGCQPCRKFLKATPAKYPDIKKKGIEIITINTDASKQRWEEISDNDVIPWVDLYSGYKSEVAAYYDVNYYPRVLIVDKDLNIISEEYSYVEKIIEK